MKAHQNSLPSVKEILHISLLMHSIISVKVEESARVASLSRARGKEGRGDLRRACACACIHARVLHLLRTTDSCTSLVEEAGMSSWSTLCNAVNVV